MRFRNLVKWSNPNSLIGLLFFAQRMEELLFDYSLDSYKPPALNSLFLCKEALSLIEDIEAKLIEPANLESVLEELRWALSNDKVVKALIDADPDRYIPKDPNAKLSDIKISLEVLERTINEFRYLSKLKELLLIAVNENKKKEIDSLARNLSTTLVNIGISKQFLYEKTVDHFFTGKGKISGIDHLDIYLDVVIAPTIHSFKLYYVVSSLITEVEDSIESFSIKIIPRLPVNFPKLAKDNKLVKDKSEVYVEVSNIRAFDIHTAKDEAEKRLGELTDFFVLFHHKAQIKWREAAMVDQCCLDLPVVAQQPKSSMEKCFDLKPQKASQELNWLLKNFGMYDSPSFSKFKRIVDLHGICVASNLPENQLLNIWISLETLIPSHSGKSKIQGIINASLPLLSIAYIERLTSKFLTDLIQWDHKRARALLKKVPNAKGFNLSQKAFCLLAIVGNQNLRDELYRSLGDFHLLRFRAFSLHELLSSPQKIIDLIDKHNKKVSWQIRRLYRTRNILVHSSRETPSYLHTLIENGHDYLDQLLWICMKLSCGGMHVNTIEQVFEIARIRQDIVFKTVKNLKQITEEDIELFFPDWN